MKKFAVVFLIITGLFVAAIAVTHNAALTLLAAELGEGEVLASGDSKAPDAPRAQAREAPRQYPPPPFLRSWFKANITKGHLERPERTSIFRYSSTEIGDIQLAVSDEEFNRSFAEHLGERVDQPISVAYLFHVLKPSVSIDYAAKEAPIALSTETASLRSLYVVPLILGNFNDPEIPKLLGNYSPNGWLKGKRLWLLLFPPVKASEVKEACFDLKTRGSNTRAIVLTKRSLKWEKGGTLFNYFMQP